jgi:hypothetical protein
MLPLHKVKLSSGLLRCSFKNPILNVNFETCQKHVAVHSAGDEVPMTLTNAVHCHHYQSFAILGRHPLPPGVPPTHHSPRDVTFPSIVCSFHPPSTSCLPSHP